MSFDFDLHPAFVREGDVIRAPDGTWWKVVGEDAEVSTPSGVGLAEMGSPALDLYADRGFAQVIPGAPGWFRVVWALVEADLDLRFAQVRMAQALADAEADLRILEASFRLGGEYVRE